MSKEDIPNYRRANGNLKCSNCKAYKPDKSEEDDDSSGAEDPQGLCEMYDVDVDPDFVCDDWKETGKRDITKEASAFFRLYDVE